MPQMDVAKNRTSQALESYFSAMLWTQIPFAQTEKLFDRI